MRKPYVILIGSASGIGKSTVASELSKKLDIKYIIETDFIREIVRGIIGSDYAPALHKSSFDAYTVLRHKQHYTNSEDLINAGFVEHASFVIPAVEKVIYRAISDNDDVIIEGVHLVPDLINLEKFEGSASIHFFILCVDEKEHENRFVKRAMQIGRGGKQLDYFKENRTIHNYLVSKAKENDVPAIDATTIPGTVQSMLTTITKTCEDVLLKNSVDELGEIGEIVISKYGGVLGDISYNIPGFKEPLVRKINISSLKDFEKFINSLKNIPEKKKNLEEIYALTNNIRTTKICANNIKTLEKILNELDKKGFLYKG
jgi:2-phosphoglycerate kinase